MAPSSARIDSASNSYRIRNLAIISVPGTISFALYLHYLSDINEIYVQIESVFARFLVACIVSLPVIAVGALSFCVLLAIVIEFLNETIRGRAYLVLGFVLAFIGLLGELYQLLNLCTGPNQSEFCILSL